MIPLSVMGAVFDESDALAVAGGCNGVFEDGRG
jgi:hypothetical protein